MVSIKDVARHAGVAISTVSKVLNHYPNVSEKTKIKVTRAVEELNFVPNSVAAALSSKQSARVALLVNLNTQTQAIDEIDMQYISGAINRAVKLNLDVITVFFDMIRNKTAEELTRYFRAQSITGIIIYGISKEDQVLHQMIRQQQFKIVVIDAPIVNENTSSVWIDHRQAQYRVAEKTIKDNNCKRILYIAGKQNGYVTDERMHGMEQLVKDLKLTMMVRYGNFSEKMARDITFRYGKNKDIVVCASDLMAIGAMNALTEMDIFRPVCGFDGITLMGYVGKQMNTVRQDFARVSAEAVSELHRIMDGETARNVVLDYTLARLEYQDIIC